jgi:hypothetical protein
MKMFSFPFYLKTAALLVLSLGLNSIQAASLREGLVSFWPLETTDGGVTPDLASGNTMSIVGAPMVEAGQRGNAFTFDGATSYLLNSHTPDNSVTSRFIAQAPTPSAPRPIGLSKCHSPATPLYLYTNTARCR